MLLQSVAPSGGRILIYVWAVDQDETSKRAIPVAHSHDFPLNGIDAFVPWVLPPPKTNSSSQEPFSQVHNRYYHFFASGELRQLTCDAAESLNLSVGPPSSSNGRGLEIVRDGYEKSNWFIELKLWSSVQRG